MTTFTPAQLQELMQIIDLHILQFTAKNIGSQYLTPDEVKVLNKFGINIKVGAKLSMQEAYKFGILSQAMQTSKLNEMSYDQFKKNVRNKTFLPLDNREQNALNQIEYQAYNEIKGLGNKVKGHFGRIAVEADKKQREKYEKIIETTARKTILNRGGVKEMKSALGHATGDWARDFDRIADFILHEAHDAGRAAGIERRDGKDSLVYKRVFDRACKHCERLYMDGDKPKVFKLSELRANGTNVGKKVADWKPVIGATHPWCRCQLEHVGPNKKWDDKQGKFVLQYRSKRAEEIAKKARSLGTVTVNKS